MSYSTLYHDVSISKDQLLNLFLGQGDLLLVLFGQKPITIYCFSDSNGLRVVDWKSFHEAKIHGRSEDPNLSYVNGKVTFIPIQNNEVYACIFELHLQDFYE